MENFTEKLHPMTVWCMYSAYFAKSPKEHIKSWDRMLYKLNPGGDTILDDITEYSQKALALLEPNWQRKYSKKLTTREQIQRQITDCEMQKSDLIIKAKKYYKDGSISGHQHIMPKISKLTNQIKMLKKQLYK